MYLRWIGFSPSICLSNKYLPVSLSRTQGANRPNDVEMFPPELWGRSSKWCWNDPSSTLDKLINMNDGRPNFFFTISYDNICKVFSFHIDTVSGAYKINSTTFANWYLRQLKGPFGMTWLLWLSWVFFTLSWIPFLKLRTVLVASMPRTHRSINIRGNYYSNCSNKEHAPFQHSFSLNS